MVKIEFNEEHENWLRPVEESGKVTGEEAQDYSEED